MLDSIDYLVKFTDDGYIPPKIEEGELPTLDLMKDTTKRSAKGVLNVDRIGSFAKPQLKIPAGYNTQQMAELLQHLRAIPINLEYFDPEIGNYRQMQFVCNDRTPKLLTTKPILYDAMSFSLTAFRGVE
jgi:hypothetical protein